MIFLLICLVSFSYVYGGTKCPDRSKIYPCICLDQPIGKSKFDTLVICEGLTSGDSIKSIEPELSEIEMDRFLLYDSYWPSESRLLRANSRIPVNYISGFKIKEVIVQDTVLSSFACPQTDNCRTNYLKRFSAFNSTVTENPVCSNHSTIQSWMSCPEVIEHVLIQRGYTTELQLRPDFFPVVLNKLKTLRMPYNRITRVDKRTFSSAKFPDLETLDLSHNSLRELHILSPTSLKLKNLDLSYNNIRTVPELQFLTNLKFLNLSRNHIVGLLQNEWVNTPANLRVIDLSSNSLDCNCATKWVNSTFHVNTNLLGQCVSPPEVVNMKIRRASRLLNERCTEQGQILASRITTTTAATTQ